MSETFNWKTGLYRKLNQATSFYGVIILKKHINEYNWFKDYSKNQIGIKVCGKWMYPPKKPP
jgi:hypothetical protein